MAEDQTDMDRDRKAADLIVWGHNQLAAGSPAGELATLLAKLNEPWLGLAQRALSRNGGAGFLAALTLELESHPERARLEEALAAARTRAENADEELILGLPKRPPPGPSSPPTEEQVQKPPPTSPWPTLNEKALFGLPGDLIRLIEPHTEADPVALLVQTLIGVGNIIGPGPHFQVEADDHRINLFAVLVGSTSKARKGSSWGHVRRLLKSLDETWINTSLPSGLASGEGLIWAVRDPIEKREPIRKNRVIIDYQTVIEDPGVSDKRVLVFESEFAAVLKALERDGNKLSAVIRQAWDDGNLQSLTKNCPAKATGAHVSIIGHITLDELRRYLTETESWNGFANRFLWACARRSKVLPEGGKLQAENLAPIVRRMNDAVVFARQTVTEMKRDDEARRLWRDIYSGLSEGRPGLLGTVTSRAEAQVMRLSCVYALLDLSAIIRREHIEAALALWEYCDASARFIFGDALGDPVADQILQALRGCPKGMTRTEISNLFGRNLNAARISRALEMLQGLALARFEKEGTEGRPVERWFAADSARR